MSSENIKHYNEEDNYGLYLCKQCNKLIKHDFIFKIPNHIPVEQHKKYIFNKIKL